MQKRLWTTTLVLAYSSLGVIYGDIGTSPLYVFASIFTGETEDACTHHSAEFLRYPVVAAAIFRPRSTSVRFA